MNNKRDTYRQRSFFQTGMPLFGAALVFLTAALCCCLRRDTLFQAAALLVVGLLFLIRGAGSAKRETERILRFVRERSVFYHRCDPPLSITGLLDCLKKEGFEVTEYPFGNYECHRKTGEAYDCHFFVSNHDTPDCPEAELYSELFIQTVLEAGMSAGSRCLLDLEYGSGLEQKSPDYIQAAREGFMHDGHGIVFGFRLACDTREGILYCAEAAARIIWQKSEAPAIQICGLLDTLFFAGQAAGWEETEGHKGEHYG